MVKSPRDQSINGIVWIASFMFDFQRKTYGEPKKSGGNNGYLNDNYGGREYK